MYQKSQWYDLQFLRYRAWQNKIGNFRSFVALLLSWKPKKSKFWKNENRWKYHFIHAYQKSQSYDVQFLRYGVRQIEFFAILCHFLPFYTTSNLQNQNFEKMKKTPGDIIGLHKCTINANHIMYGSLDMQHDRQNFLSFWTIFFPFTLLTTMKIKILKKWKKHQEISLYTHVPYMTIMMYCSWKMEHFGPFFALLLHPHFTNNSEK